MVSEITPLLVPPKRERLPDTIASQIRGLIVSKKIEVGNKLPSERELAENLNVSRVVVKQALKLLEQSGFVEIKTGAKGGAFITYNFYKPFFNAINDLMQEGALNLHHFFEARRSIEGSSIRLAAEKATDEQIEYLAQINDATLACIDDPSKLHQCNMNFHIAIAEISGNPLIKYIVQSLLELMSMIWDQHYPGVTQDEAYIRNVHEGHQRLVAAMKEKDFTLCEQLMFDDTQFGNYLKSDGSVRS